MFAFTKREHIYGCEILNQVFEILNEYEIVTIINFLIYRYHYNSFANLTHKSKMAKKNMKEIKRKLMKIPDIHKVFQIV